MEENESVEGLSEQQKAELKREIESFLARFIGNFRIFDLYPFPRLKNMLKGEDWAVMTQVILRIRSTDYAEGPNPDTLNKLSPMWVFGKNVNGRLFYIKISLGLNANQALVISFHPAVHPMSFPLKTTKKPRR